MLKKISFSCEINLTIGENPNKKNIESLNLTHKVNLLRLWRGKHLVIKNLKTISKRIKKILMKPLFTGNLFGNLFRRRVRHSSVVGRVPVKVPGDPRQAQVYKETYLCYR